MMRRIKQLAFRYCPEMFTRQGSIRSARARHDRLEILNEQSHRLARILEAIDCPCEILVSREGVKAVAGGVILNPQYTNRYLKTTGENGANEGEALLKMLLSKGIQPTTVLDIGANFGEISLYFLRHVQAARVFAVEASPENLVRLQNNVDSQLFDTSHLTIVPQAVSDQDGYVLISKGWGAENSIMITPDGLDVVSEAEHVSVPAVTVEMLFDRYDLDVVDFMKVDIEGAEPLLLQGITNKASKISSLFIEFSNKNSKEEYLTLIRGLYAAGFQCPSFDDANVWLTLVEVEKVFDSSFSSGVNGDYWFFNQTVVGKSRVFI